MGVYNKMRLVVTYMKYTYKNEGVCSRSVSFDLNDGIVSGVSFVGGCNGNLKAIGKLAEGMKATDLIEKLSGNTCGFKNTSCADQFAKALSKALENENK